MSTLTDQLTAQEGHHSLFEDALRALPCAALPVFGNPLNSAQFVPSDISFPNTSDAATSVFPQLMAQNPQLLQAKAGDDQIAGKRVAVLFSGGPAAGGHNVVLGICEILGKDNTLLGVRKGPKGLLNGELFEISHDDIMTYRNMGGFDFLTSDRTKIKTDEQFQQVRHTVQTHKLDAIIVIGGDDSNTNAAALAEYLIPDHCAVIGVPKTIDGDLQLGQHLPISFGFDTATKIYSEMVGNILQDTPSSAKYWHFIKLMGRSASHVTLEVGLQCKPAITLISEEIAAKKQSLNDVVTHIAQVAIDRASRGIHHGVVLVPEGVIEFIPEFQVLIQELNDAMAGLGNISNLDHEARLDRVLPSLSETSAFLLRSLPSAFSQTLLNDRDSHGNLQVSLIETEKLLAQMVAKKVAKLDDGRKLGIQTHFFGYEGRCGAPTRFDANYTYNLGLTAGSLALGGHTGYMAAVTSFESGGVALALPLAQLVTVERRDGKEVPVIEKALVALESPAFQYFVSRRDAWAHDDVFCSPGPIQHWGATANQLPISVALNQGHVGLGG